jgi:hypothetical protein
MKLEQELEQRQRSLQRMKFIINENVGLKDVDETTHLIVRIRKVQVRIYQLAH